MEHQELDNIVIKNYTFTAALSFAIIFCLFFLMSNCHGDYNPKAANHHSKNNTETPTSHH